MRNYGPLIAAGVLIVGTIGFIIYQNLLDNANKIASDNSQTVGVGIGVGAVNQLFQKLGITNQPTTTNGAGTN